MTNAYNFFSSRRQTPLLVKKIFVCAIRMRRVSMIHAVYFAIQTLAVLVLVDKLQDLRLLRYKPVLIRSPILDLES